MRVIALTVLALIFFGDVACTRTAQPDPEWQPVASVPGAFRRYLAGDTRQPGPFKYQLKIPAGSGLGAFLEAEGVGPSETVYR